MLRSFAVVATSTVVMWALSLALAAQISDSLPGIVVFWSAVIFAFAGLALWIEGERERIVAAVRR